MFYNHCGHEGNVIVIPSTMGTCQGDLLGRALFILVHFKVLCSIINHFFPYLFPCIVNDIHIIDLLLIVSFIYKHFHTKLHAIGFFIQYKKCVTWSPFNLLRDFTTPS